MYYIIETKYVGPNRKQAKFVDASRIEISTQPAKTNSGKQVLVNGWCGQTNYWSVYAHGEYPTLEAAQAAISTLFGKVRDRDPAGEPWESMDESVVATYHPGQYIPMDDEGMGNWVHSALENEVTADFSDEQVAQFAQECEEAVNREGYTFVSGSDLSDLEDLVRNYRDELRMKLAS